MKRLRDELGRFVLLRWLRLLWQLFSFVQNVDVWMWFSCFCRVSNHEKKLEAVRSGVRAISVSGKLYSSLEGRHLQCFHQLCFVLSSFVLCLSLFLLFDLLCLHPSLPSLLVLFTPLTSIHVFFHCQTPVVFSRLAADLMTWTPPKPTRARRFLLPFVFCPDSPPNGISWHSSDHRWRNASTKLWRGKIK